MGRCHRISAKTARWTGSMRGSCAMRGLSVSVRRLGMCGRCPSLTHGRGTCTRPSCGEAPCLGCPARCVSCSCAPPSPCATGRAPPRGARRRSLGYPEQYPEMPRWVPGDASGGTLGYPWRYPEVPLEVPPPRPPTPALSPRNQVRRPTDVRAKSAKGRQRFFVFFGAGFAFFAGSGRTSSVAVALWP